MEASEVYQDRIITFKAPPKAKLNINGGWLLSVLLVGMMVI